LKGFLFSAENVMVDILIDRGNKSFDALTYHQRNHQ